MSIRDLLKDLSKENDQHDVPSENDNTHEVSEGKEAAVTELIDHAAQARQLADQLAELADKADDVADTDKQHLLNEVSLEAFQMNYRHLMQTAGLGEAVGVNLESSTSALSQLQNLSKQARAMSEVAINLESRVLDYSPEGKIWSFFRMDSQRIAKSRGDIETYANRIIRQGRLNDVQKVPVEWTFLSGYKHWIIYRNGKAVSDFAGEVVKDLELVLKSFKTIANNNRAINKIIGDARAGKPINPSDLRGVRQPEIIGEHILGDKYFKPSTGEWSIQVGWTPSNPHPLIAGLALLAGPIGAAVIIGTQMVKTKNALESAKTHIDGTKLKRLLELTREVDTVLDRADHTIIDTSKIKAELSGEEARYLVEIGKQSMKTQAALYEHAFFLINGTAEVMRSLHGSWELFIGEMR